MQQFKSEAWKRLNEWVAFVACLEVWSEQKNERSKYEDKERESITYSFLVIFFSHFKKCLRFFFLNIGIDLTNLLNKIMNKLIKWWLKLNGNSIKDLKLSLDFYWIFELLLV